MDTPTIQNRKRVFRPYHVCIACPLSCPYVYLHFRLQSATLRETSNDTLTSYFPSLVYSSPFRNFALSLSALDPTCFLELFPHRTEMKAERDVRRNVFAPNAARELRYRWAVTPREFICGRVSWTTPCCCSIVKCICYKLPRYSC